VCSNPALPNGTACNDGNACTQVDTCQNGACTGQDPVVCAALDQCHAAGTCNPATGQCSNPPVADGTACNDGNACTQTDTCQAGACTGGNPVVCAAVDPCHVAGACNTTTGQCSSPAAPNGTACNDGNACTQVDTCQNGACTGQDPVVCAALDQCHAAGACNAVTGQCSNPPVADGTACNDGNACTQTDTCQGGACAGGNPVVCAPLDACHVAGTCNTATGQCSNPAAPNGAPPGGGTACNTGLLGVCAAGTTTCNGGAVVCHQNVQPSPEICDGLDNNCNGQVDEGDPGGGGSCNTGLLGVCAAGTVVCTGGSLVCEENVLPSPEICDGRDNDCDGLIDEGDVCTPVCVTIERGVAGNVYDTQIAYDPTSTVESINTNFGSSEVFNTGMISKGVRQALLGFDLGPVPAGAQIQSATLQLWIKQDFELQPVRVHRITAPWSESTVTWASFDEDYDPAVEASFSNNGPGYVGEVTVDISNLVEEWVEGSFPNDGVLLEQSGTTNTSYWSSEYKPATRPALVVCYTNP
jgi:hypothetical protein